MGDYIRIAVPATEADARKLSDLTLQTREVLASNGSAMSGLPKAFVGTAGDAFAAVTVRWDADSGALCDTLDGMVGSINTAVAEYARQDAQNADGLAGVDPADRA